MAHFMKLYFHTCQYLFTAYFRKIHSSEMHFFFIKLSVSACLPTFINTHPRKKTYLLFCFWFRDSRVIIVTFLPSLESADSECVNTSLLHASQHIFSYVLTGLPVPNLKE